jgi:5-methylcytosine-specific restriction endonuclease McrA
MSDYRVCAKCLQQKPISSFTRYVTSCDDCDREYHRLYQQKWRETNRAKEQARNRELYQLNAEKIRERKRKLYIKNKDKEIQRKLRWQKANPEACRLNSHRRRQKLKGNGVYLVTPKDVRRILSKGCFYCGKTGELALDHVIPVARGGVHSVGNLVAACQPCNSSKNDKFITEWAFITVR